MKIKLSDTTPIQINWLVAKCMTGEELFQCGKVAHAVVLHSVGGTMAPYFVKDSGVVRCVFEPSTNWSHGGPIIERENIDVTRKEQWEAWLDNHDPEGVVDASFGSGPTPLIAAMRCFVASRLGDEVEIPEELK